MRNFTLIPTPNTGAKWTPVFRSEAPRVCCVSVLVKVQEGDRMVRRPEMEAEAGCAAAKIKAVWSFGETVLNEEIDGQRVTITAM